MTARTDLSDWQLLLTLIVVAWVGAFVVVVSALATARLDEAQDRAESDRGRGVAR